MYEFAPLTERVSGEPAQIVEVPEELNVGCGNGVIKTLAVVEQPLVPVPETEYTVAERGVTIMADVL